MFQWENHLWISIFHWDVWLPESSCHDLRWLHLQVFSGSAQICGSSRSTTHCQPHAFARSPNRWRPLILDEQEWCFWISTKLDLEKWIGFDQPKLADSQKKPGGFTSYNGNRIHEISESCDPKLGSDLNESHWNRGSRIKDVTWCNLKNMDPTMFK